MRHGPQEPLTRWFFLEELSVYFLLIPSLMSACQWLNYGDTGSRKGEQCAFQVCKCLPDLIAAHQSSLLLHEIWDILLFSCCSFACVCFFFILSNFCKFGPRVLAKILTTIRLLSVKGYRLIYQAGNVFWFIKNNCILSHKLFFLSYLKLTIVTAKRNRR